jgi:hypothetical protein
MELCTAFATNQGSRKIANEETHEETNQGSNQNTNHRPK